MKVSSTEPRPIPKSAAEAEAELLLLLKQRVTTHQNRRIDQIFPDTGPLRRELYPKHMDFFAAGAIFRERVAFGGNRTGKSWLGGYEMALHLTGEYPDWWRGRRFSRPVSAIACGKDGKIVRDSVQKVLLGPREAFGTGFIPKDRLDRSRCTASRAASGMFDEVPVRHASGGLSTLHLKSYDQGREAFEATERDVIWEDEEAPLDVHKENLMRTMTTNGCVFNTFTPLKGETDLVRDLRKRVKDGSVYQVNIWWDDCPHITSDMIKDMLRRYQSHEIRARRYGEPQLGAGAIYTIDENELKVRPFQIPDYWPRAFGLDFGFVHPTAVIWGALDRESDTVYLYAEYRRAEAQPAVHASAIKARGEWIPGVSETQGQSLIDGQKMYDLYKKVYGLNLKRAVKGRGSLEAGIANMQDRISQSRLKVFENLRYWFEEYRTYHRDKKGKVVDESDDLMDATRYLMGGIHKYAKTLAELRMQDAGNVVELRFGRQRN